MGCCCCVNYHLIIKSAVVKNKVITDMYFILILNYLCGDLSIDI